MTMKLRVPEPKTLMWISIVLMLIGLLWGLIGWLY